MKLASTIVLVHTFDDCEILKRAFEPIFGPTQLIQGLFRPAYELVVENNMVVNLQVEVLRILTFLEAMHPWQPSTEQG